MKVPLWATLFTLVGIVILCGLGFWQVQRLQWKTDLLAALEAEYAKGPMHFELTYENLHALDEDLPFIRGFAEGIYLHDQAVALGPRTHEGKAGYHVITPFETLDNRILLVNRGWVPADKKQGPYARPDGALIVKGMARRPEGSNPFIPPNEPARGQWYRLDPEEIARAQGLSGVLPWVLYAEEGYELPVSGATKWRPANNHLSYAVFWFTMAAVLAGIYYLRFIRSKTG